MKPPLPSDDRLLWQKQRDACLASARLYAKSGDKRREREFRKRAMEWEAEGKKESTDARRAE